MKPQVCLALFATFIASVSAAAVPDVEVSTSLELRNATDIGVPHDPKDIHIDCKFQEDICNQNCYSILCVGKSRVLTRGKGLSNEHRKESGYNKQPFKHKDKYNVKTHTDLDTSPEEYPFASSQEGGEGAVLGGVFSSQQSVQGANLNAALMKANVNFNEEYRVNFNTHGTDLYYCKALNDGDKKKCHEKPKNRDQDWVGFAYIYDQEKEVFHEAKPN